MMVLGVFPLPPTTNHAYETVRKGAYTTRRLSDEAKSYKHETVKTLVQHFPRHNLKPNTPYGLLLAFYLNARTQKGGIRKLDISNRVKLIEDAFTTALGIDDSQYFDLLLLKRHEPVVEHVRAVIWDPADERDAHVISGVLCGKPIPR